MCIRDRYCYVNVRHLPRFFEYKTHLTYSKMEYVNENNEIKHPAIRNAMNMLNMHEIRLVYEADLPARSGLGTSSSFAVGMLKMCIRDRLKVICGILKPYKGTVTVNGTIAPLIELGAGFDGDLTARENIYLNGAVLGHDEQFMKEHFDEIVEFAELENFLDMPIKNYSSGMAARLGFAIATVVKPDILICDEVLAVGDYAFQRKCEKRMKKMREEGTTLLYVSCLLYTSRCV